MLSPETVEILNGLVDEDLYYMVEDAWREMCGEDLILLQESRAVNGTTILASVDIRGTFGGSVVLECGSGMAKRAASHLFQLPPEEITDDHEGDVLGELANIVGGVIKGALDGDCTLSLPLVVSGGDVAAAFPRTEPLAAVYMDSGGDTVVLRVLRRNQ